jgi:hypothetical protein
MGASGIANALAAAQALIGRFVIPASVKAERLPANYMKKIRFGMIRATHGPATNVEEEPRGPGVYPLLNGAMLIR